MVSKFQPISNHETIKRIRNRVSAHRDGSPCPHGRRRGRWPRWCRLRQRCASSPLAGRRSSRLCSCSAAAWRRVRRPNAWLQKNKTPPLFFAFSFVAQGTLKQHLRTSDRRSKYHHIMAAYGAAGGAHVVYVSVGSSRKVGRADCAAGRAMRCQQRAGRVRACARARALRPPRLTEPPTPSRSARAASAGWARPHSA